MAQPADDYKSMDMDMAITDDDLNMIIQIDAGYSREDAAPLSPRIGLCSQIKYLNLNMCSRLPPEISNCQSLVRLSLKNCNDPNEFPQGIVLEGLTIVIINVGIWNEDNVDAMFSWLASCYCPKLAYICFENHTRVTTKIFMEGLLRNETFPG
ncbi:MAG: hypothetical protein ACI8RD_007510 [Bacillariaceae sp.]|jgi:hypothetical protein